MAIIELPNGFGANFLDTALLAPGYCLDLMDEFNMAEVTIVDATHPKEAFWLAVKALERRPYMRVNYRIWREHLKDENMFSQVPTAREIVEYFRPAMEAGLSACVYNEAIISPMTPMTTKSREIIELTAPRNWKTTHYKIAMGNPGGYAGEHLLAPTHPSYRPDGYAESDNLWRAAYAANKPRIDAGLMPLVSIAPHAYFPVWGLENGLTDRHREIWRRLDALNIPRWYVPLSCGETGLVKVNPLDAESGWVDLATSERYADIFDNVMRRQFLPDRVIAHLYAVGDKHPGDSQWRKFNLMGVSKFWERLKTLMRDGAYKVPSWYGIGSVIMPVNPIQPPVFGAAQIYTVKDFAYRVRSDAGTDKPILGEVKPNQTISLYPQTVKEANSFKWYYVRTADGLEGWSTTPYTEPPIIIDPPPPVTVNLELRFSYEDFNTADLPEIKNAYAALADFVVYTARARGDKIPQVLIYINGEREE